MPSLKTGKFEKFFQRANFFYKSIGVKAYADIADLKTAAWLNVLYYGNLINCNFCFATELISFWLAVQNGDFIEVTLLLTYMGFILLSNIKIANIAFSKVKTTAVMRNLRKLYEIENVNLGNQENRVLLTFQDRLAFGYIFSFMTLVWVYNLYPLVNYLIHIHELEPILPYGWMPKKWENKFPFYIFYVSQNWAAYTAAVGQVANDLLLCAVCIQLILHYRNLAGLFEATENCDGTMVQRIAFLEHAIQYHQKLLNISKSVNSIFGVSLLLNFMSSSLSVCFLGFLMTTGAETFILIKLFLFFFCSLLQIYMICNCAQELIESSKNVGYAVYNHKWTSYEDVRYRKMLILLIKRAQKPAVLQATSVLNISLVTMTDLLQLSYQFFALLRTLYSK